MKIEKNKMQLQIGLIHVIPLDKLPYFFQLNVEIWKSLKCSLKTEPI